VEPSRATRQRVSPEQHRGSHGRVSGAAVLGIRASRLQYPDHFAGQPAKLRAMFRRHTHRGEDAVEDQGLEYIGNEIGVRVLEGRFDRQLAPLLKSRPQLMHPALREVTQ
jgi:hypothetical protein